MDYVKKINAEKILDTLTMEVFHRWYESKFVDFIEGCDDAPSKETILEQITSMFKL